VRSTHRQTNRLTVLQRWALVCISLSKHKNQNEHNALFYGETRIFPCMYQQSSYAYKNVTTASGFIKILINPKAGHIHIFILHA
jgi:hypothetical protein